MEPEYEIRERDGEEEAGDDVAEEDMDRRLRLRNMRPNASNATATAAYMQIEHSEVERE